MVKQGPRGTRTKEKGPQLTVVGSVGDARSWPQEETSLAEAGEVGWGFKIPLGGEQTGPGQTGEEGEVARFPGPFLPFSWRLCGRKKWGRRGSARHQRGASPFDVTKLAWKLTPVIAFGDHYIS